VPNSAGRLAVLQEVLLALSGDLDRRQLYEGAVSGARRLLGVPLAAALAWDPGREELVVEAVSSDDAAAPLLPAADLALCTGPAYSSRTTVVVEDLDGHPRAPAVARALKLGAAAATPLVGSHTVLGAIFVAHFKNGADRGGLSPEDLRLLELLANHVGLMLVGAEAVATAVRRLAKAEELAAAFRGIGEARDRDVILMRGLDCATTILGADRAAVYLSNGRDEIHFVASRRLSRMYIDEVIKRFRRSVGGLIPVARTPIYVADMATDPRTRVLHELAMYEGLHSALIMPLIHRGQLFGAIALYHDLVWSYGPEDLAPVRGLADEMALALAHTNLHVQTQRQLAHMRVLEQVARGAAEAGSATERAERAVRAVVERGAAVRAWALRVDGTAWATAGEEPTVGAREAAHQAAQAAVLAGRAIARPPVVAAPLRHDGALVLELPLPRPVEARPPTIFQVVAEELDLSLDLDLATAVATHLVAAFTQARASAAQGLAAALAGVPAGVLLFDDEGRVVFHNQAALAVHGLDGHDPTGWRAADFLSQATAAKGRTLDRLQAPVVAPDGTALGEVAIYRPK
jgi:GAF domain-containing protein